MAWHMVAVAPCQLWRYLIGRGNNLRTNSMPPYRRRHKKRLGCYMEPIVGC